MKLIKISSCLLILALIASSCGASKRTLRKNNEALQNLLQTSIQATALQTVNSINRDTSIPAGEAKKIVSRDNPGQTALERTVIRWFIDSSPKGAQVFYRVISSVPDVMLSGISTPAFEKVNPPSLVTTLLPVSNA